jgi:hypothetical protein
MSQNTTPYIIRWHADGHTKDGVLRHPTTNSEAWKTFDNIRLKFSTNSHNVRLRQALDGFNPFENMSTFHITRHVMLVL